MKNSFVIVGYMGAGKDTAALFMPGYIRASFANELKIICRLIRMGGTKAAAEILTGLFSNKPPDNMMEKLMEFSKYPVNGEKDRKLLQEFGTDWARKHDSGIWIRALKNNLHKKNKYVITDARFMNEFMAFPDFHSIFIDADYEIRKQRIIARDGFWDDKWEKHSSEKEIELMKVRCKFIVNNNGTLEQLKSQIEEIVDNV
jgi:dephospho-CoA kinase